MSNLESVLIKNYGKKTKVFKSNGEFTRKGYKIYCNFCEALYELESIVKDFDAEKLEKQMDSIIQYE